MIRAIFGIWHGLSLIEVSDFFQFPDVVLVKTREFRKIDRILMDRKDGWIMCRLFSITSKDPLSPMVAIRALDVMKEVHDGSGVGLFMTDMGGDFEQFRGGPILSGIFSNTGIKALDRYMMDMDFMTKYKLSFRPTKRPPAGTPRRDNYLIRVYEYPLTGRTCPRRRSSTV